MLKPIQLKSIAVLILLHITSLGSAANFLITTSYNLNLFSEGSFNASYINNSNFGIRYTSVNNFAYSRIFASEFIDNKLIEFDFKGKNETINIMTLFGRTSQPVDESPIDSSLAYFSIGYGENKADGNYTITEAESNTLKRQRKSAPFEVITYKAAFGLILFEKSFVLDFNLHYDQIYFQTTIENHLIENKDAYFGLDIGFGFGY